MLLFPILNDYRLKDDIKVLRAGGAQALVIGIPWALIAAHYAQAQRNHGQTLEQLARRGGLSASEAVAVLENRRWRSMPILEANARLLTLMAEDYARSIEETDRG